MLFAPIDRLDQDVTVTDQELAVDVKEETVERKSEINIQSLTGLFFVGLSSRFS